MANTGIKNILTLRKYVNGEPTSITKSNVVGDPDYIAPYEDIISCPIGAEPPASETTMSHLFTDSDGLISNYSNATTTAEGATGTYNFSIMAPTGQYWASAPTFSSDTTGCTATASVAADNTLINVVLNYTQGADSTTATYTYASSGSLATAPANVIDWDNGTTVSVSSPGNSPVTQTVSGTLTISGADQTFRAYVLNNTNYDNVASVSLTVNGTTISATTDPVYGTYYSGSMTKSAGTYGYTLTITLSLVTGNTMGAASAGIQSL
jgi:hypothetical protein